MGIWKEEGNNCYLSGKSLILSPLRLFKMKKKVVSGKEKRRKLLGEFIEIEKGKVLTALERRKRTS